MSSPRTLNREDLSRIVTLIKAVDGARGPEKKALQMRLLAEVTSFMASLQEPGAVIDEKIWEAFPDSDSRQAALLGYCALVLSILQSDL